MEWKDLKNFTNNIYGKWYAGGVAFMAFSSENGKILGMVSVHNELLLGKKSLQVYGWTFFKKFC